MTLYTFGHGTNDVETITELLRHFSIESVCDVRTVPKSRRNPQFWRGEMERWIPAEAHCTYQWLEELGGFRKPRHDSPNVALRHPAFRGYADYMQTHEFKIAFEGLIKRISGSVTAIMCSETLWWRCHRRLISDAAVLLRDVEVIHIAPHAKPQLHKITEGARRVHDTVLYDGGTQMDLRLK